jgi:uncharacterized damage-inducible protein DinB
MKPNQIILQLDANRLIFKNLFQNKEKEQYEWRPDKNSWSLLEIVCHLYDEEREDFRTRVFNTLMTPDLMPPSIDPPGWVKSRAYAKQDYHQMLNAFLRERISSVIQLHALRKPQWDQVFNHPTIGPLTAYQLLANWLAHDYHHIRQVNRRLYEYLRFSSRVSLAYAGDW